MIPQIILIALLAMNLGICLVQHGTTRIISFWYALIGNGIIVALLWWGGFWEVLTR